MKEKKKKKKERKKERRRSAVVGDFSGVKALIIDKCTLTRV